MKNFILFVLGLITSTYLHAQTDCVGQDSTYPCCNGIIHTGPDVGKAINLERPPFRNQLDWRTDDYNVYQPLGGYDDGSGGPAILPNPFKTTGTALQHINYYNVSIPQRTPVFLDYHLEDGWELLHRNLGYKPDEVTYATALENRRGPYIVLYNKTTALFRVIAALDDASAQNVNTQIEIVKPAGSDYAFSALFAKYDNQIQTLDEESRSFIASSSVYQGANSWFVSDFYMSYDPCVCNQESRIVINFQTVTTASVSMDGRLIATSVPLDGSGTSPMLNGKDYLMGVHQNGFNVNGGMLTYSNMDSLVAKLKTPPGQSDLEKKAIGYLGDLIRSGLGGYNPLIERGLTSVATAVAYKFVKPFQIQEITGDDSIKVGYDLASKASDFFVTALKRDNPPTPNVGFIEGELSLSGSVTTTNLNQNYEVILETPGSKSSQYRSPDTTKDWTYYPAYNEAMGLIAVLEKPTLRTYVPEYAYGASKQNWRVHHRHYELNTFKYTFNPAAEIDTNNTVILMALKGKFRSTKNNIGNFSRVLDADNSDSNIYSTDFYPPECLHGDLSEFAVEHDIRAAAGAWRDIVVFHRNRYIDDVGLFLGSSAYKDAITLDLQFMVDQISPYHPAIDVSDFFEDSDFDVVVNLDEFTNLGYRYYADSLMQKKMLDFDLKLQVLIQYQFKENKYGKVNTTLNNQTYNTLAEFKNPLSHPPTNKLGYNIPRYLSITGNTVFIHDTIEAYDSIFVFDDNINWPSTPVVLRAPGIVVYDSALVDGADVTLQSSELPKRVCRDIRLGQVPPSQVKSFCLSSSYKADSAKFKNDPHQTIRDKDEEDRDLDVGFKLYPNPTNMKVNVAYRLNYDSPQHVSVRVLDMVGRELLQPVNEVHNNGVYVKNINVSDLKAGIYFVTLKIGDRQKTQRLVITR